MECFECKSEIPDGARRCRYCGAAQPIPVTQPRRGGCLRIILCTAIIIIALWIVGTSLNESKETKLKQSPTTQPNTTEIKTNGKPSATISIKPQNEVSTQKKVESKITVNTQESTTASTKNESHTDKKDTLDHTECQTEKDQEKYEEELREIKRTQEKAFRKAKKEARRKNKERNKHKN